jgi:hypothetical protein
MYSIYDERLGRLMSTGRNSPTKAAAKEDLLHYLSGAAPTAWLAARGTARSWSKYAWASGASGFGDLSAISPDHCTEATRNERAVLYCGPAGVARVLLMRNDPSGYRGHRR